MENTGNVKLPRLGSAARVVLMNWEMRGGQASWTQLEAVYMDALRRLGRRPKQSCTAINLLRLLNRYGTKLGPPQSRAQWRLDVTNVVYPPANPSVGMRGEVEAFLEGYFSAARA